MKDSISNLLKSIITVVCVFFTHTTFATHIMGGMMTVSQTSWDSTSVGLYVISDMSFISMTPNITVQQWKKDNNGTYILTNFVTLSKGSAISHHGTNVHSYSSDYLDLDSGEYRFIYETCCWQPLNNSPYSYNYDIIISADYRHVPNNSLSYMENPLWINMQIDSINVMKPMFGIFNCFFTEPDGDSIHLEQTQLYSDYNNGVFTPQPSQSPSNMWVHTDSMTFVSSTLGLVGNGFEIKEYRNGQLLGTQRIQWPFKVVSSTVGITEYIKEKQIIGIWDWQGRKVEHMKPNTYYIVRYNDGTYIKLFSL